MKKLQRRCRNKLKVLRFMQAPLRKMLITLYNPDITSLCLQIVSVKHSNQFNSTVIFKWPCTDAVRREEGASFTCTEVTHQIVNMTLRPEIAVGCWPAKFQHGMALSHCAPAHVCQHALCHFACISECLRPHPFSHHISASFPLLHLSYTDTIFSVCVSTRSQLCQATKGDL